METSNGFRTQHYQPYFSEEEVQFLTEKQKGKLSQSQEERARQQACAFIDATGAKLGFPKRTTATAQVLYHRFHLYFHRKSWSFYDVTLAALYVSTKIHDTLKKPRDLLMAGYALRYPELAAKSKATGGEVEMDPATVASDTEKLLGVERLMLEGICFNFSVKMPFPYIIKLGRTLRATKQLALLAWRLAVDSNRTHVPLLFPPHTIALACFYLAALLSSFEVPPSVVENKDDGPQFRTSHEMAELLGKEGDWEKKYCAGVEDLDEIAHTLIDLIHSCSSTLLVSSNNTSPSTPSTPSSPHPHVRHPHTLPPNVQNIPPPPPYKPDQLIRLKIAMRGKQLPQRKNKRKAVGKDPSDGTNGFSSRAEGIGTNTGTTRFLFGSKESNGL